VATKIEQLHKQDSGASSTHHRMRFRSWDPPLVGLPSEMCVPIVGGIAMGDFNKAAQYASLALQ